MTTWMNHQITVSKARGDRQEELPHAPKPEAKSGGGEEQPQDRGQGRWPEDQPHV